MKHLRYVLRYLGETTALEKLHPVEAMRRLGITYTHSTPQSLGEQWWFWNCDNIPAKLPAFLSVLDLNPHDQIGYGLSPEEADEIERASKATELHRTHPE